MQETEGLTWDARLGLLVGLPPSKAALAGKVTRSLEPPTPPLSNLELLRVVGHQLLLLLGLQHQDPSTPIGLILGENLAACHDHAGQGIFSSMPNLVGQQSQIPREQMLFLS